MQVDYEEIRIFRTDDLTHNPSRQPTASVGSMPRVIARNIAAAILRPMARQRTLRALKRGDVRKLVIGGSTVVTEGWLSTDISPRARFYLDATKPWPMPAGTLDYVFADNMIEHVDLEGARLTLAHAYQALRDGGTIRLSTPDIERTARLYLAEPSPLRDEVLARARHDDGTPGVYPIDMLRLVMTQAGHHLGQLWDFDSLAAEMRRAGFSDVRRCEMGESGDSNLRGLESRDLVPAVSAVTLVVEGHRSLQPNEAPLAQ